MSDEEKPGLLERVVSATERFFNFNKDGSVSEEMKLFRDRLLASHKALIVLVLGPSKSGKSTLLNYLTIKDLPLLDIYGRNIKGAKKMMYFKTVGGVDPGTTDFKCKVMKASEFMGIHGIEIPADFEDYDIFFIDTEGFSTIKGVSSDLYLGMFSLLGGVCVQIYMDKTPMTNAERIKHIAQNINMSKMLGNKPPKTISIERGGTTKDDEDNDDDDDGDDNDDDGGVKYNEKLYKKIKEQDESNKDIFIEALSKEAIIDEDNYKDSISIQTLTRCDAIEGVAFKKLLKDLANMIMGNAVLLSGKELLERIDNSYNKVLTRKEDLKDEPSIDKIYSTLLKEYCHEIIDAEEKDVLNNFREVVKNKSHDELKSIYDGKNTLMNDYSKKPYNNFVGKITKIIPSLGSLDEISKGFFESVRYQSEEEMRCKIKTSVKLRMDMKTVNGITYRIYQANPFLYDQEPDNIATIRFVDSDANRSENKIKVQILGDKIAYDNGEKKIMLNRIKLAGIKVLKTEIVTTKEYSCGNVTSKKTEAEKIIADITEKYDFNFPNMELIPKDNDECTRCEYSLKGRRSWLLWKYTDTIRETRIKVTIDEKYGLKILKSYYTCYDWKDKDNKESNNYYLDHNSKTAVVKPRPHEIYDRTNETRLTSFILTRVK